MELRHTLMNHAIELYAEHGILSTTMDKVAEAAGVEAGTAHAIFTDNDHMLEEVLTQLTDPIVAAITIAVEEIDDPFEMIDRSMKILDRFLLDNPVYVKMFIRAMAEGPAAMGKLMQRSLFPSGYYEKMVLMHRQGKITIEPRVLFSFLDMLSFTPHIYGDILGNLFPEMDEESFYEFKHDQMMNMLKKGIMADK